MASFSGTAGDITLAMQNRLPVPRNIADSLASTTGGDTGKSNRTDDAKARDVANKFEALLIHNMLKSMRRTTMTEGKSNDRAIYDDMLDEKLADTMMEAGGIGIADQIVAQIRKQQGKATEASATSTDILHLRELASHIPRPEFSSARTIPPESTSSANGALNTVGHLRLATGLWGKRREQELSHQQQQFMQPLLPHAIRNAAKLGTSPNAILAIAALETGWGRSIIKDKNGDESHNLFGIKATSSDNRYATTLTTEYIEGSPQKLEARFKTFASRADAVDGFADFIRSNPRYSNALKHAGDPERFLRELQAAGYATDPRYADKAISIMRQIARNPLPL